MAIASVPFVGQAYEARSLNLSAQRCINLFLEMGANGAKSPAALFGTPGLTLKLTMPNAPAEIRGMIPFQGRLWVVSGDTLFSVTSNYSPTIIGKLSTDSGPVSMAVNETQIGIVDGVNGFYYDFPTLTFATITDPEFPTGARRISYLKSRFLVEAPQAQTISWSAIGDVRLWDGLDFTAADGQPDNIVSHISDHQELYVFGETTTQLLVADSQGFSNNPSVFMQQGCAAAFSPVTIDNSIMWLGRDEMGQGVVWQARGGASPVRVSNHGIEFAIGQYSRIDDAIGYAYQQEGHLFYVLTFPTGDETWVYDVSTQGWHQRAYMTPADGSLHRHRSNCHAMFNGDHIVGDWENGKLYAFDLDNLTDDGDAIISLRSAPVIAQNQYRMFFNSFQVDIEAGVGTATGQGQAPRLMMRYSNDSGHSWSNRRMVTMGKTGQYSARARFNQCGAGRNRVFEISITDPVKRVILGAYADITAGTS